MKIASETMDIFKKRLDGIEGKILYEIEHIYNSGMVDESTSLSAVINAAVCRVADQWERGNVRDHNNMMMV